MRTFCPVCHGLGTIPDPKFFNVAMSYCGINGERSPHTTCPNCFGGKYVGTADNDPLDPVMPNPLAAK